MATTVTVAIQTERQNDAGLKEKNEKEDEKEAKILYMQLNRPPDRIKRAIKLQNGERLTVEWEEGTIDNEHMNKKKSKSKFIYLFIH